MIRQPTKNSRRRDRELKSIGKSRPTIIRARKKLEKRGMAEHSQNIDLTNLGFDIVAITFGNLNQGGFSSVDERTKRGQEFLKYHPDIVFFSTGRGFNSDRVAITAHKNYTEYREFIQDLKTKWADIIAITGSFLISLSSDNVLRPFSYKDLIEGVLGQTSKGRRKTSSLDG